MVIGARPGDVPEAVADRAAAAFTTVELAEFVLTVAVAQGFSKAAIAWGPPPELPTIEVPTPTPDATVA